MGETVEYYVGEGEFRFKFTWDEEKAQDNIEKHGISFEVACWAQGSSLVLRHSLSITPLVPVRRIRNSGDTIGNPPPRHQGERGKVSTDFTD
ncbi:MAG: hypothetical protein V1792_20180 [Pseudomonadota bacterium]